jgi:hypothetical protein
MELKYIESFQANIPYPRRVTRVGFSKNDIFQYVGVAAPACRKVEFNRILTNTVLI